MSSDIVLFPAPLLLLSVCVFLSSSISILEWLFAGFDTERLGAHPQEALLKDHQSLPQTTRDYVAKFYNKDEGVLFLIGK